MITLTTALPCEAKPLIKKFGLQNQTEHSAFRIYQNDDLRLAITGVGKLAAASAVGFLNHDNQREQQAWLNVGIAGHATHKIGTAILAHKIIDAGSHQCWYPVIINSLPCISDTLTSVDQVHDEYAAGSCYDMEASGFFAAASRFTNIELIHSLKIISDNRDCNCFNISSGLVDELITAEMDIIEAQIEHLRQMTTQLNHNTAANINIDAYIEHWHFTHAQRHQLRQLLQRWQLILPQYLPFETISNKQPSDGKSVLIAIKHQLDNAPISFS